MTLATKNGSLIVKNGSLAENCGCCGGWYCVACETITPSGYSTTTFNDDCWLVYGNKNPLTFGSGYASRCVSLKSDGDLVISITATLASRPANGATVAVCIGSDADAFSPFGGGGFRAFSGFAVGLGSDGTDRAQSGWPGNLVAVADSAFSNTLSASFSRRSGKWYVSSALLPEVEITLSFPQQDYLFHGVQGTNGTKVFSSYSVTVS